MENLGILSDLAKIGGIAGLCLGVLTVIFRDVIRVNVLSKLSPRHSYELLRLVLLLTFTAAIIGIGAWIYSSRELKRGLCAPMIRESDSEFLSTNPACQPDLATTRAQAIASAQAVKRAIIGLTASQRPYFFAAIVAYVNDPTSENWSVVVKHRRTIDDRLIKAIGALNDYTIANERSLSTNTLKRLLTRRIAYLAKFNEARPMEPKQAMIALRLYNVLTEETLCALRGFIIDNGGEADFGICDGPLKLTIPPEEDLGNLL